MSEPLHFASPFAFSPKGVAKTNIQDSPADRLARALNVCLCIEGTREDNPGFGIPDLTFTQVPPNIESIRGAIERWAEVAVTLTEAEEVYASARRITVGVS